MEREVTNSPGTCSATVGNTFVRCCSVSVSRLTTVTVMGRWRTSVTFRVPVTTTSSSESESTTSAHADRLADKQSVIKRNNFFIFFMSF